MMDKGGRRLLCRRIAEALLAAPPASGDTTPLKIEICAESKVSDVPGDPEILSVLTQEEREILLPVLRRKPVRAISGVSVVAVMTSPARCPHGTCIYCPGGLGSPFGDVPQSYTGLEPAARRGVQAAYDPYKQVAGRIASLEAIGHSVSKIELIVMGGTFPSRGPPYQRGFVKGCFDAANGGPPSTSLAEAIERNETAAHRLVGLTVETKPDWCLAPHVDEMLSYGTTRVELGVQTLDEGLLASTNRGHGVAETAAAFRAAKDAGLKVVAHMMPFLPGASRETDVGSFRDLFSDPRFKPDELKIYPTQVVRGTGLYGMWKAGNYREPSLEEVISLLSEVKEMTPRSVRIKRVLRDIPSTVVDAGTKKSDIRQIVLDRMAREGRTCRCIRCREIGQAIYKRGVKPSPASIRMNSEEIATAGGREVFLSLDEADHDLLVGLLRLRMPQRPLRRELEGAAIVRELHVYGWSLPVSGAASDSQMAASGFQHRGFGKGLLLRAEELSLEAGFRKLAITSGVGVRGYYAKLGYSRDGPYMTKRLKSG